MRVLIACEFSGVVRDAFIAAGHEAISCDLLPTERPGPHIVGDVLTWLDAGWDMMIAHPPCQYLCSSGLHWNNRVPGREAKSIAAMEFAMKLWKAPIRKKVLENPVGRLTRVLREAGAVIQMIQPNRFGHDASKATCLILHGVPELIETKAIPPRMVNGKPRWANQTDSGQNRLGPSEKRAALRATTYQGIADAMACQWGNL